MRLNLVSEKLCKSLLFKYVFSFTMRLLLLKLLQVKVVKVLFGHPVPFGNILLKKVNYWIHYHV